jgi:protease-4
MARLILAALAIFIAGCGTPSFLITPVSNTHKLQEHRVMRGTREKIAIIDIEGMLINARTGGFMQPTENKLSLFTEQINRAAADSEVKAIVLRVNSPGGTVTTSDTMYEMLMRFKAKTNKPVIASFQEVAASGAYYLSCAADRIIASPTSVVGSIGVIFNTFELSGAMSKLGVRAEAIKSGPLKDMGSPFHALTEAEREVMQGMVDEYYGRFVSVIRANRPTAADKEKMATATDGRVFSGIQAMELGLVDETGMLQDAIKRARQMAKAPRATVVMYKRPFGFKGSIYASGPTPQSPPNVLQLELPGAGAMLPTGFYYMWQP